MHCQREKFNLDPEITYLNCSYMSPQMKQLEAIGIDVMKRQGKPYTYSINDFFEPVAQLKKAFADLIETETPDRIAIVPSVSYGLANVANNLHLKEGEEILVADEQFPSNIYAWQRVADEAKAKVKIVPPPTAQKDRGKIWNEAILTAITDQTKMVAIGHVHWKDGTLFDLKAIREKTNKHGALLVIDGTQSVGALPFSVKEIYPDALICGGYKWLMGPYSLGVAYYGPYFDNGIPIEENWLNRLNSEDFTGLVDYQPLYRPLANRYSVGEQSNFILTPLLLAAIQQLNTWGVDQIQAYCQQITRSAIAEMRDMDLFIEADNHRSAHLFGVTLNDKINPDLLKNALETAKILVSFRGNAMRIGPNVYNDEADLAKLLDCLKKSIKKG